MEPRGTNQLFLGHKFTGDIFNRAKTGTAPGVELRRNTEMVTRGLEVPKRLPKKVSGCEFFVFSLFRWTDAPFQSKSSLLESVELVSKTHSFLGEEVFSTVSGSPKHVFFRSLPDTESMPI